MNTPWSLYIVARTDSILYKILSKAHRGRFIDSNSWIGNSRQAQHYDRMMVLANRRIRKKYAQDPNLLWIILDVGSKNKKDILHRKNQEYVINFMPIA